MTTTSASHSDLSTPVAPLIRHATMDDIDAVLGLHRLAFADKFSAAFGVRRIDLGIEAMATAWRRQGVMALQGMLVAQIGPEVVGTATLRTWEMSGESSGTAELAFQQVLGVWLAARSIFTLSLLDHRIDRHEGYITDVAVSERFRRRGIATQLLLRAEEEALFRRKRYLALYVAGRNRGAILAYEQLGYKVARVRNSLLTAWLLRQREWIYMRKELI
jgi:ribosomal protein S18 acetylase RimI-like enzyme